jgi:hypothetical protein
LAAGTVLFDAYALLQDQKSSGVDGGTATSGSYQTRTLNTEVFDSAGIVALAANQFTLQAGTYYIDARAPAFAVNRHKAKLRNITAGSDTAFGSETRADSVSNGESDSWVRARVTLAGATVFELQHRVETTNADDGYGIGSAFGDITVYSQVMIWREAS